MKIGPLGRQVVRVQKNCCEQPYSVTVVQPWHAIASPDILVRCSIPPMPRLSLHRSAALHEQFDGQMVDFAGWNLPIRYRSIIEEHHQVRKSGGFFDVSHMGRLYFDGPGAVGFLDRLCTRKIEGTAIGQCRYGILCNDAGGCRDDVIISRLDETRWLMVVNGANREKILGHIEDHRDGFDMTMDDRTDTTAMCALQGPKVMPFLGALLPQLAQLKRYRLMVQHIMGAEVILSRTGYTGEDGVELIMDATLVGQVLAMLGDQLGADATIQPCGLGARDTLRMEAGMPLYGHELSETLNPLAAGLGFAVKCDKGLDGSGAGPFIGQEKLAAEKGRAHPRALWLVSISRDDEAPGNQCRF